MPRIIIMLAMATCLLPLRLLAWGQKGHEIIAEIAFDLASEKAKANVKKYLGDMTIQQASTWMDDVKHDRKHDFMKSWHYVDFEKGAEYHPSPQPNIVNALNNAIGQLEQKNKLSDDDIKFNLLVIIHLMGDLHQPLHVGYASDKGGNDLHLTFYGHSSNLHRVWDSEIIELEHISTQDCLSLYKSINKAEADKLKAINVELWVKEPRSLLPQVYDFRQNIGRDYADKNKTTVERQLLIAGIRLAALLDRLFG